MRANRRLRLIHRRGGALPALLAGPDRIDQLEVVEIETSEVVLYADLPVAEAPRVARAMKGDLAQLEVEDFLAKWSAALGD